MKYAQQFLMEGQVIDQIVIFVCLKVMEYLDSDDIL